MKNLLMIAAIALTAFSCGRMESAEKRADRHEKAVVAALALRCEGPCGGPPGAEAIFWETGYVRCVNFAYGEYAAGSAQLDPTETTAGSCREYLKRNCECIRR